jgi:hypothetical protein
MIIKASISQGFRTATEYSDAHLPYAQQVSDEWTGQRADLRNASGCTFRFFCEPAHGRVRDLSDQPYSRKLELSRKPPSLHHPCPVP